VAKRHFNTKVITYKVISSFSESCIWWPFVFLHLGLDISTYLRHIRLGSSDESAMAEHRFNYDHHIQFHNTDRVASKYCYMDKLIEEVIEMEMD
jgi:hypothetical protein